MAFLRRIAALVLMAIAAHPACASIKDYQIIRLLTYKTECQVNELKTL